MFLDDIADSGSESESDDNRKTNKRKIDVDYSKMPRKKDRYNDMINNMDDAEIE